MMDNPVWEKIWNELQADFERRHCADERHVHALIVCELSPDTPDFGFIPIDEVDTESRPP